MWTGPSTLGAKIIYSSNNALNIKAFGAICDGTSHPLSGTYASLAAAQAVYPFATALTQQIDWAATQAALNALPQIDNTANTTVGGGAVYVPPGNCQIRSGDTITVPPGTVIFGESMDASRYTVASGDAAVVFDLSRPAAIVSSFTRRGGMHDLSVFGSNTAGNTCVQANNLSELEFKRLYIYGCDIGMYFNNTIVVTIEDSNIANSRTNNIFAENGVNGFEISNTRTENSSLGANVRVEGPNSFSWVFTNLISESAGIGAPTAGHGILIGSTSQVKGVTILGSHFESNGATCVTVGAMESAIYD